MQESNSPTNAEGKRIAKNIYAKTREERETKLAALIVQMKAEIAEEKQLLKAEKPRGRSSKSAQR